MKNQTKARNKKENRTKVLYIEAQLKKTPEINLNIAELPKELFIAYSIQYKKFAEDIRKKLENAKIKIAGFQQVLGCTKLAVKESILLIGSGRFHALNLALQNSKVYIYNNSMNRLELIDEKEIEELKKQKKAKINRFLHAEKIGIIVSTKPGQSNLRLAEETKKKIEKKYAEKQVYLFISNHINTNELENFNIDFWLNSACSGLANDSTIIANIDDIETLIN